MKKTITVIVLLLAITSQIFSQTNDYKYRINDVHCHYVNFIQETDGIEVLLEKMDSASVDNIVLFGLSVTKLWTDFDREQPIYYDDNDAPVYYYAFTDVIVAEAVKSLHKKQQDRIYPMICGFNPADKNGLDHIKRMVEMYPDLWVGIGEVFFRHDDLTRMTYGRNPTANCASMDKVYDYAAEKNLPMWIHSDIGDPIKNEATFLYEMEEAIMNHPNTKMVWCHVGNTRGVDVDGLKETTRRLLKDHKNLYYDISWVVYENIIAPNDTIDQEWIKIFEDFPTRFMVGTDKIGGFSDYVKTIRKYDPLFDALKPETARKLASENMFELLPRRKESGK